MEDLLTVINGREAITDEIDVATEVGAYVAGALHGLIKNEAFLEALPGHLLPDPVSHPTAPHRIFHKLVRARS
jgi:hypothetical protein